MTDRALQRLIHVACRDLGLDADTRHDLQLAVTGKASMADMSDADLQKVVDALRAKGFNPAVSLARAMKKHAPAASPGIRFIHVMWGLLAKKGAIKQPGRRGLNLFVRSRFEATWGAAPLDIDMLTDEAQINDVTQALKAMCRRAGIEVSR